MHGSLLKMHACTGNVPHWWHILFEDSRSSRMCISLDLLVIHAPVPGRASQSVGASNRISTCWGRVDRFCGAIGGCAHVESLSRMSRIHRHPLAVQVAPAGAAGTLAGWEHL